MTSPTSSSACGRHRGTGGGPGRAGLEGASHRGWPPAGLRVSTGTPSADAAYQVVPHDPKRCRPGIPNR